jgi:hypothetical protein
VDEGPGSGVELSLVTVGVGAGPGSGVELSLQAANNIITASIEIIFFILYDLFTW